VIVAEDAAIVAAREQLQASGSDIQALQIDLARAEGVEQLYEHIKRLGRSLDAAALNAGVGGGGAFATDTALDDELRLIDLNVRSTVHLAKYLVGDMVARDEDRILLRRRSPRRYGAPSRRPSPGAFKGAAAAQRELLAVTLDDLAWA